jgi:PAS domain S-box-containing protein
MAWHHDITDRLRRLPIRVRLRLAFVSIILLLLIGSTISLWYWWDIRQRVEAVSLVERRMTTVFRLHNTILTVMNQLHRAADSGRFAAEATRLLGRLERDSARIGEVYRIPPASNREAVMLHSLHTMLEGLPGRVRALVELAEANDWLAVHARLLNQTDRTDDVIAALVQELDHELATARQQLLDNVHHAQRRTLQTLALTGVLSIALAALLGFTVTRSITRPLALLTAGTRSLAQGAFEPVVVAPGNDELADFGRVLNQTAGALKDAYTELRLSEAHFRSLIENAADLIMVLDQKLHVLYVSPSSMPVLGYTPEQLIGRRLLEFLSSKDLALAEQRFAEAPDSACSFEWRFQHADGAYRIIEGRATNLLGDAAVAGIVINARDISERREAEQALRDRDEQLRQKHKMEAIGRLAGGVAHDFNNLLTVINGYSQLLLTTLPAKDPQHAYVKEIHNAGERAAELSRQLLAFGRRQLLQLTVLNLNTVVRDVERMLRRIIGEDVALLCHLDPSLNNIEADVNQLHQVLLNLAANARDAMPDGGLLTIETANSRGAAGRSRSVILRVTDTGHGMDDATRDRMFEPFFTTKPQGKGTGLGLATVYGIVRQVGGTIAVETAVGRGTTFAIAFPRVDRELPVAPVTAAPSGNGGGETILVVEDQPEVRQFAVKCLRSAGYEVLEAGDAEEALALFARSAPIHVIVTDVVMPGISGVELSRQLLAQAPDLRIVFVSGYADNVLLRHGVQTASAAFLQKPYQPSALAAKVREVICGSRKGQSD